jgi:hypothetical protein
MTAKSSFRKYLGPIFQKSWESYLFLTLLIVSFVLQVVVSPTIVFFLLPWIYFAFLAARLLFLRVKLHKCQKRLKKLLFKKEDALPVAIRLTDQEILYFAKNSEEKIREYIAKQHSLRWKVLTKAYRF